MGSSYTARSVAEAWRLGKYKVEAGLGLGEALRGSAAPTYWSG